VSKCSISWALIDKFVRRWRTVTDRWLDFDRGQLGHATYCDVRAAPNWRPFLKIFASGTLCLLPRFYDPRIEGSWRVLLLMNSVHCFASLPNKSRDIEGAGRRGRRSHSWQRIARAVTGICRLAA